MKMVSLVMISFLSLAVQAQTFEPYTGSLVWENASMLPQFQEWQPMYQEAEDIANDLSRGGGKYSLIYKQKGGSSHQALVIRNSDQKTMGIWSAPNHATYIEGEIFAFNIARLLNRSQWATPATKVFLTGEGRIAAQKAMEAKSPAARECNRAHILNYINANPHYIMGMYKQFEAGVRPVDIPELVDRENQKRLNPNHSLVQMISNNGPQPKGQLMYLSKSKRLSYSYSDADSQGAALDTELAKQLSFLALVDALNSQRDRFGPYGSNMEAMYNGSEKTFKISLVDNGGTADSAFTVSLRYFTGANGVGVSRFEREVFNNVLELDNFLKGKSSRYLDYHSVEDLKVAVGYETYPSTAGRAPAPGCGNHMFLFEPWKKRWDIRWSAFVKAVDVVATHMRKYERDQNAFFDENQVILSTR